MALYDRIGATYAATRRDDPRIAAAIHAALGDARSVVNVGAGTGSYEPRDRDVIAVEPSVVMIAQRPPDVAPVVEGTAEALPLADASVDAAMAILTDQHWTDCALGLRELLRVARRRVVALTFDRTFSERFWLTRDYLGELRSTAVDAIKGPNLIDVTRGVYRTREDVVAVPHDCRDGFYHAFWRRPEAYLEPAVRAGISVFHALDRDGLDVAVEHLERDLASGAWARRNAELLGREAFDYGYRLLRVERLPDGRWPLVGADPAA